MRPSITIFTALLTLSVIACGGDTDVFDAQRQSLDEEQIEQRSEDESVGGDEGEEPDTFGNDTIEPPVFLLTGPVEPPAGWIVHEPCHAADEGSRSFYQYFVPPDWRLIGSGSGGAGGVINGTTEQTYELPGGGSVEIVVRDEQYLDGRPIAQGGGALWETWDFDLTSYNEAGDETIRVTFDSLPPVELDGTTVELYYLDQAQNELLYESQYTARVVYGDLPSGASPPAHRTPGSTVVTFTWDSNAAVPAEDDVRTILSAFRLGECVQSEFYSFYERLFGIDWSPN